MKNYIYSKILYQQLQEWETWLASTAQMLKSLLLIQAEMHVLKPLFCY